MDKKIENKATVILLEILGILGVGSIIKTIQAKSDDEVTEEERGYFIIDYLFRNVRQIQPQLEELIVLFVEEDVNILEGIGKLKDDKDVVDFFTQSLGEVMKSV
jgi:predicted nuclease of restriction endonuclease-like RecB superfamily